VIVLVVLIESSYALFKVSSQAAIASPSQAAIASPSQATIASPSHLQFPSENHQKSIKVQSIQSLSGQCTSKSKKNAKVLEQITLRVIARQLDVGLLIKRCLALTTTDTSSREKV
jgi:hypothetical protein